MTAIDASLGRSTEDMVAHWPFRVMAGLDPAIHGFPPRRSKVIARASDEPFHGRVDGRVKPGHDGRVLSVVYLTKSAP